MDIKRFKWYAILYLIVGIIFIIYYRCHRHKYKDKFGYNGFFFSIILYYIAVPVYLFLKIDNFMSYEATREIYGDNSIFKYIYNSSPDYIFLALGLIIVFYLSFNIGYNLSRKKDNLFFLKLNEEILEKTIKFFIHFSFIVGSLSLILLFRSFGGIRNALAMAEYYRSFSNEASSVIGLNSLFLISSRLITITPFLVSYYIEKYRGKKYSLFYIFQFVVSFAFSILFYLYYAGRFPLICFFLALFYIFIRNRVKKPWTLIIILGIVCLPLLDVLNDLFTFFSTGYFTSIKVDYVRYIYDFIYPIRNVINVIPLTRISGYRFFTDLPLGILDLLPGISLTPPYYTVSAYFFGYNWKMIGGIPTDAITFGFFQLNFVGVILFAILIGFIIQKIDFRLDKLASNSKYYIGSYFTMMCFSIVNNADTYSFFKGQFFFIIIFIILIFSSKRKEKK